MRKPEQRTEGFFNVVFIPRDLRQCERERIRTKIPLPQYH